MGRVVEVLRRLVFVMLGPLWEGTIRSPARLRPTGDRAREGGGGLLSAELDAGILPPQIAAPALLAAVTFLAAESGTRLAGIAWNRQLLVAGEDDAITAETLLWHLDGFNAGLVQDLFAAPFTRPFALLLTALRADCHGLGAAREATRRKGDWRPSTRGRGALRRERERRPSRLD